MTQWVVVVDQIAYTPTKAVGPYESQELAQAVVERDYWAHGIGAHVVPLEAP